jgi:hypothetical protein
MALSKKEMYHGAVLYHIVGNPDLSLKLFERDKEKHAMGMCEVAAGKNNYVLFIKYRSQVQTRRGESCCDFSFLPTHIESLSKYHNKKLLVCLVCHDKHICVLERQDIDELKLLESNGARTVSVSWREGTSLTVKSGRFLVSRKIPRNRLQNFNWRRAVFAL